MCRIFTLVAAATLMISFGACGKSNSSTAPSPTPSASTPAPNPAPGGSIAGATITGTVVRGSAAASFRPMSGSSITVTVVGTSIAATVDAGGNFTLEHVPAGDDELEFEGVEIHARIRLEGVAEREEIRLRIVVSGATVDVESNERHTPDNRVELEGKVTDVNVAARTLRVGNTTVMVPSGTPIRDDGTALELAQLHAGDRVHIRATANGTTIVATDVKVQGGNHGTGPGEVELKGTISGKSGACPSLSFTVSSMMVTTSASTKFEDTPCTALANGDQVEVKGRRQANGSVLATRVEGKKAENEEVELSGTMSAKAGTCPSLTFTVSSTSVATNASTKFEDTACGALTNGDRVEVKGARQSNGTVLATRVEKKK